MAFLLKKINADEILNKFLNGEYESVLLKKTESVEDCNFKSSTQIYGQEYVSNLKEGHSIRCNWCSNDYTIQKDNIGIPIEGSFLTKENKFFYKTEGIFCSYECAYALLKILMIRNPGMYINSENLLKHMFEQDHPGKKLIPANDFWLQRSHGGPLNSYDFTRTKYKQSHNRILVNVTSEYNL